MSDNAQNAQPATRDSIQCERILRIDVTGNGCLVGKTTVTALIAKALKEAFPETLVQVYSGDGDFHYRCDAPHHPPTTNADRIVIVDVNAPQPRLEDTAAGRVFEMFSSDTGPHCTTLLSKDAPHIPVDSLYGSQTGGLVTPDSVDQAERDNDSRTNR